MGKTGPSLDLNGIYTDRSAQFYRDGIRRAAGLDRLFATSLSFHTAFYWPVHVLAAAFRFRGRAVVRCLNQYLWFPEGSGSAVPAPGLSPEQKGNAGMRLLPTRYPGDRLNCSYPQPLEQPN